MTHDEHEYKHPYWMLISRFTCGPVVALGIIIALPKDFNFLLSIFIAASVVSFMEDLHISIVERPRVRAWHDDRVDEHHKEDRRG